jgi:hypothetical protein
MRLGAFLIAVACLILAVTPASAQSDRGNITGTVSDPAGAMIPNTPIEAKNIQTGAVYQTVSSTTGNYTLAQLPVGVYQLTATQPGFKQYIRTGITVMVAQTLRIDIALEVGNINETVTVSADAPLLKTESGELSHNVAAARVDNLPILGFSTIIRDPLAVMTLLPGAFYQNRAWFRVNGAPSASFSLRVDGMEATNGMLQQSTGMSQQSVAAIEEYAVQTSNYAAEFGQAGGGYFNVTMRSGTNSYHGSAYDYFSNEALNAAQPYVNIKSRVRRNNYGFTLGGPVWIPKLYDGHDKTFFFFNFEQYREQTVYNQTIYTMPTLAYRSGDFRQALTGKKLATDPLGRDIMEGAVYDPSTERLVNGQRVRDPFMGCDGKTLNVICTDPASPRYTQLDPVALKIQSFIPLPTNSDITNNYRNPWISPNIRTIPSFKINHNLSTRSKLSFFWSATRIKNLNAPGPPGGDGIPTQATTARNTHQRSYMTQMAFDHTITPTMVLHLSAGGQNLEFRDPAFDTNFDQLKELGLKGSLYTVFPFISGLSAARGGMSARAVSMPTGNMGPYMQTKSVMFKPSGSASLTWVKYNHTYKFGAELRQEKYPTTLYAPAYGYYNFSAEQTGLPSTLGQNLQGGTVGFSYASFLLGLVANGNTGVPSSPRLAKSAWSFYAQDTWKVTRNFTLDYGLRWDYQDYFKDSRGRVASFSPTTLNPSAGNLPGAVIYEGSGPGHCNCDFARVYPYAFGPRFGAAYQITPKTVLRLGWGVSYGQTANENQASWKVGANNPYYSPAYGSPAGLLRNGMPTPPAWPIYNAGLYPLSGTLSAPPVAIDGNAGRPPRQIQWSIGIQREIFTNLVVEASYVGNRGAWWEANDLINVNALSHQRIASFGLDVNNAADRTLLTSALSSSTAAQRGFNKPPYAGFPMTATVAQSLRPFPQFAGSANNTPAIAYMWAPLGRTWYDSLQVKVTKRYSHGLDFTSAFTWQKELTMGAEQVGNASGVSGASINNVFDRHVNKYLSMLSRPFTFVTALNYTLPTLKINKILSLAIRDWTFGATLQYASGLPIKAPIAQTALASVLYQDTFANRVPGEPLFTKNPNCHCVDPRQDFILNPNAWVDPPAGQFGVGAAYYNDYRQQRRPGESMSLGRTFRFKEDVTLNIRADFQNIFNRTEMNNPTSTNAKQTQTRSSSGTTVSGFGYINPNSVAAPPRAGIIVASFRF